jgi:hypothetical protein
MGPAFDALLRRRPGDPGRPAGRRGIAIAGTAIALNLVIAGRGISDRWTGTLGDLDPAARAALLAVALWLLAGCLDALRLLLRRSQQRRAARVASSMAGSLSGRAVFLTDLTMLGAGIVADRAPDVGTAMQLDAVVPTRSGVTTLSAPVVVRNVVRDLGGGWRIGLEFEHLDPTSANALAELCVIEPARRVLGGHAVEPVDVGVGLEDLVPISNLSGQRRLALRATTLFAVAGVVASAGSGAVEASALPAHRITGVVTVLADDSSTSTTTTSSTIAVTTMPTSTAPSTSVVATSVVATSIAPTSSAGGPTPPGVGGVTVVGVCSDDAGPDGRYGTSDDSYTSPVSTVTGADGSYALDVDGRACWVSMAPPPGYAAVGGSLLQVVDASAAAAPAARVAITPTHRTTAAARTGSLTAVVWSDTDADGVRGDGEQPLGDVTVTLYDSTDAAVATAVTGDDGRVTFGDLPHDRYEIGVSNLPGAPVGTTTSALGRTTAVDVDGTDVEVGAGVVDRAAVDTRSAAAAGTGAATPLPTPRASQVAARHDQDPGRLAPIVITLAAMLGASVVLGAARPRRRGRQMPSDPSSPDLAMR